MTLSSSCRQRKKGSELFNWNQDFTLHDKPCFRTRSPVLKHMMTLNLYWGCHKLFRSIWDISGCNVQYSPIKDNGETQVSSLIFMADLFRDFSMQTCTMGLTATLSDYHWLDCRNMHVICNILPLLESTCCTMALFLHTRICSTQYLLCSLTSHVSLTPLEFIQSGCHAGHCVRYRGQRSDGVVDIS